MAEPKIYPAAHQELWTIYGHLPTYHNIPKEVNI